MIMLQCSASDRCCHRAGTPAYRSGDPLHPTDGHHPSGSEHLGTLILTRDGQPAPTIWPRPWCAVWQL